MSDSIDRGEWLAAREADFFAPHPQNCRCLPCAREELAGELANQAYGDTR